MSRRRRRGPIEEIRRALAAIGADVGAHAVPAPAPAVRVLAAPGAEVVVRRTGPPVPAVRAPAPLAADAHDARPPDIVVRTASLGALRPAAVPVAPVETPVASTAPAIAVPRALRIAPVAAPEAHVVPRVPRPARSGGPPGPGRPRGHGWTGPLSAPRHGASGPLRRPPRRRPRPLPATLMRLRRTRADWATLPPGVLRRAWRSVAKVSGTPASRLRLVGLYGPMWLGRIAAAGPAADGERIEVLLDPRGEDGVLGYVAIARDEATGRTHRASVPRPGGR